MKPILYHRVILLVLASLSFLAIGCGPSPATMNGLVKYGGKPVDNGVIMVQAIDGSGSGAKAPIVGGKYEMGDGSGLTEGTYRVQIHGFRKSTRKPVNPGENMKDPDLALTDTAPTSSDPNLEPYIPTAYNTVTELKIEVKAGANDNTDFDLKVVQEKYRR